MTQYWNRVDLNRIPEQEMNEFASRVPAVRPPWQQLKRKYGMYVLSITLERQVRDAHAN